MASDGVLDTSIRSRHSRRMKRAVSSWILSALLVVLTQACTGEDAPWSSLTLPLPGGTVVKSDGMQLRVRHGGDALSEWVMKYGAALQATGFRSRFRRMSSDIVHVYRRDKDVIVLRAERAEDGSTTLDLHNVAP